MTAAAQARRATNNKRIKVSTNFYLDEFIPKEIYSKYGSGSIKFLDWRVVNLAQAFRSLIGKPCIINNWWHGGSYNESGFRLPWTSTGASLSQHKFGRAIDIKVVGIYNYDAIRDIVRRNFQHLKRYGLTSIEVGTRTWLHMDCRRVDQKHLYEIPFYSKKSRSLTVNKKYVKINAGEHAGKVAIFSRDLENGYVEVLVDLDGDDATPPVPIRVKRKHLGFLKVMNWLLSVFFNWFNNRKVQPTPGSHESDHK